MAPDRPRVLSGLPTPGALAFWALERLRGERLAVVFAQPEPLEEFYEAVQALAPMFPGVETSAAILNEDPLTWPSGLERLAAGARLCLVQAGLIGQPLVDPALYGGTRLVLKAGERRSRSEFLLHLESQGYRRADFVEGPGEVAVRGSVTDFWLVEPSRAVRVYWDEDQVASIREFDPATQRTERMLDAVAVVPLKVQGGSTVKDWLRGWAWVLTEGVEAEVEGAVRLAPALSAEVEGAEDWGGRANLRFQGRVDLAAQELGRLLAEGCRTVLMSLNRGELERMEELLGLSEGRLEGLQLLVGPLSRGFVHPRLRVAVLTAGEIFERSYRGRRSWPASKVLSRTRWRDLKIGDYVVHHDYGVARYLGLKAFAAEGASQDLILLEFRGGDKLFIPLTDFRKVQKYVGAEGKAPRLSSLDTRSWEKVKGEVKEGIRELAEKLLKLEAARSALPGHAFPVDGHLEREFAASFPYEETPDQARAIEEVKRDMESPHPMNRVVVGDVGFGKTEVAMRAALKCALDYRQVAVLVPTTVLADQHFRTFKSRLADYPIQVGMLSRFETPAAQKRTLEALAQGKLDIVVGTHRLLQKDVRFKRLGLLVVDEEHRFGVGDKEKIRELQKNVDALVLSATPIPRTLYQSLSGLREISLIQSPPAGRLPIVTTVGPLNDERVKEAVLDELARDGQVFYVHNRVQSLPARVAALRKLLPGVRFAMAHGQMRPLELEKTMWDFFGRKYDVLAASAIIESGLDIPSVNTMVIENAHEFGLAQLYQLRGRIGRERRRAICHLFYPAQFTDLSALSEDARKRLEALKEFAELGSGFRLALRDLEIRGAGELLGPRQHGFLNAIGLEYYTELLQEEVERLKGRSRPPQAPVVLDLKVPAFIPADYLPDELERLNFYKRIMGARLEELAALKAELADLCGEPPAPVESLFGLVPLRLRAQKAGLRSVVQKEDVLELHFAPDAQVPPSRVAAWARRYGAAIEFLPSAQGDGVRLRLEDGPVERRLEEFLSSLEAK